MNEAKFNVDDSKVLDVFASLSTKKMKNSYKNALKKSSRILVNEAKKNFRKVTSRYKSKASNLKNGWHTKTDKNGNVTAKSLQDGIKFSVSKDAESSKIHIMGDFRLKFFEMGTKVRQLRKNKAYRGRMTASWFFKTARNTKEQQIETDFQQNLRESILKAARR